MRKSNAKLYLIPNTLGYNTPSDVCLSPLEKSLTRLIILF